MGSVTSECLNAPAVACNSSLSGSNALALPVAAPLLGLPPSLGSVRAVWFSFVVSDASRIYRFFGCSGATSQLSSLAVFKGGGCAALQLVAESSCSVEVSGLAVGTQLYVMVTGAGGLVGTYTLTSQCRA